MHTGMFGNGISNTCVQMSVTIVTVRTGVNSTVIQSTYIVVFTGDLHLCESADEETNHYEGECATRSVRQQPPYKITEKCCMQFRNSFI